MSDEEIPIESSNNEDPDDDEVVLDDGDNMDIQVPEAENYQVQIVEQGEPKDEILTELKERYKPSNAGELRLIQDLKSIKSMPAKDLGFSAEPYQGQLSTWEIHYFGFEPKDSIYPDIQKYKQLTGKDYIKFMVHFPPDYPIRPPFVRVVEPRFQMHTGRITVGGSICADILTMNGWNPSYDVSSCFSNIFAEIISQDPKIDFQNKVPYSKSEAFSAYIRVAKFHGWKPSDFDPNTN